MPLLPMFVMFNRKMYAVDFYFQLFRLEARRCQVYFEPRFFVFQSRIPSPCVPGGYLCCTYISSASTLTPTRDKSSIKKSRSGEARGGRESARVTIGCRKYGRTLRDCVGFVYILTMFCLEIGEKRFSDKSEASLVRHPTALGFVDFRAFF